MASFLVLALTPLSLPQPLSLPRVLVTGATGRTGSALYAKLKADPRVGEVRALVRNITRARLLLNCSACNASDGIFVGDVTDPATMTAAFDGVDTVAIAVGVGGGASASLQKAVEFSGVENQVTALTHNRTAADVGALRVVFCSSMGTTNPHPPSFEGGPVLFWKLNAEAFLGSSGVASTIVKPCGLTDHAGGHAALGAGHDDHRPGLPAFVARQDVAAVMAEAVVQRSAVRFLLCNKMFAKPTTDLAALLEDARWPWQRSALAAA